MTKDLQQLLKLADRLVADSPFFNRSKLAKLTALLQEDTDHQLSNRKSKLHLSASALVFQAKELIFIHHPYLDKTLLPAGHVEEGETSQETALRELFEETGFQFERLDKVQLIDINIFDIPANPLKSEGPHHHIDLRYYFEGQLKHQANSELPVSLLNHDQAPEEFRIYFQLLNK
ncbi:NUDIX domain-containing protein [Facklamia miroungae]|uniref:ADP-ribose pyrophosphatase YjhB, NUDIX family n=1 Tax=Facklamia miroungae TaxID=120956 RepID=A0A1G7PUP4_9LACT|nr:NUDIX domain-containing protein [Facklamia miroungae]NKZ28810.1 NUDIX domain-containing protein [Facklamia miroungae]SDF89120.1 ADP-ribose pyrophosphatase YjhB, NUDIX family [Facklamia miroungae]